MIEIWVEGFRGIREAHIWCDPISLIEGPNESGKSSVSQAVAAVLTGASAEKQFSLTKATSGLLIHDGAKLARCIVKGDGGESRMSWPEGKLSTTGAAPPKASLYAAGILSVAEMERAADRATTLLPYLKAEPSYQDFTAALAEAANNHGGQFAEETVKALWAEIEKKGWEDTHSAWETVRRDAGRDWEKVTGERFGSEKAATWSPPDLSLADIERPIEELDGEVSEAAAEVEHMVALNAIESTELERLRSLAAEHDDRAAALSTAKAATEAAKQRNREAMEARQALPVAATEARTLECPHCTEKVVLGPDGTLRKHEPLAGGSDTMKARQLAIADADGKLANAQDQLHLSARAETAAEAALKEAIEAQAKIAAAGPNKAAAPGLLATARETLAARQRTVVLRRQMAEASGYYRRWLGASIRLIVLSPKGLRAKKMAEATDAFNTGVLAPLAEAAGWAPVRLEGEDLSIAYGVPPRPYKLNSDGGRWRARVLLQIAMARIDGSDMVIIDGLPDLDLSAREGLFALLASVEMPAIVCLAEIRGIKIPDLAAANLGGTWRVEGSKTLPFGILS